MCRTFWEEVQNSSWCQLVTPFTVYRFLQTCWIWQDISGKWKKRFYLSIVFLFQYISVLKLGKWAKIFFMSSRLTGNVSKNLVHNEFSVVILGWAFLQKVYGGQIVTLSGFECLSKSWNVLIFDVDSGKYFKVKGYLQNYFLL